MGFAVITKYGFCCQSTMTKQIYVTWIQITLLIINIKTEDVYEDVYDPYQ